MKKFFICLIILTATLAICSSVSLAQEENWQEGIINEITETTITIDEITYNITYYTIIMDENEEEIDISRLPRCCEEVKFSVIGSSDIEKIVFNVKESRW